MQILIVEDELLIAQTIADLVATQGDEATIARDGVNGLHAALSGRFDAMVLDVMLPGMDGFTVARRIREQENDIPILMLTARTQVDDRVTGLDCGADYYLTKPFSGRELLACLRALCRRKSRPQPQPGTDYADLHLELSSGTLLCQSRSVRLSRRELELLSLFLAQPEQVIGKEEILRQVWRGDQGDEKSVEVYISVLRKKLQYLGSRAQIRTLRTLGYRLEEGGEA